MLTSRQGGKRQRRSRRRNAKHKRYGRRRQFGIESLEHRRLFAVDAFPQMDDSSESLAAVAAIASAQAPVLDLVIHPFAKPSLQQAAEPSLQQANDSLESALDALPLAASFDLRDTGHVTTVKDQGALGSCWAFATYGALESAILMEGGTARDLSENHLTNHHGFDWEPDEGGQHLMSQAYLSRWSGPVNESDDPYHDWDDSPSPGGPPQYFVRESLTFDTDEEMKRGMMAHGAVYTTMRWDAHYYNDADDTYNYHGSQRRNHAVLIVGWDDAKQTDASEPGAWLVRNSWGTDFGDNGYFWLSYQDALGGNSAVSFHDAVPADTFQTVYYHDEFGHVGEVPFSYALNAFTPNQHEDLAAVQFWTQADGAQYDLRIYDTFSQESLTDLLVTQSGTFEFGGQHTLDLASVVPLTPGDAFYVYLQITNGGEKPQAIDVRARFPNGTYYNSESYANPGESYYSLDGVAWTDLTTYYSTANFAIKALTVDTPTSDSPPPRLVWPMEGEPFADTSITNYMDHDPTSGVRDYNGGTATYDGHQAIDIVPGNFGRMDEGVKVFAAADGVVTEVHDGEFDRQTQLLAPSQQANYVRIDHGDGWETTYLHLRRDSIQANIGQEVKAGEFIAYVGSSGRSTDAHLHFGLYHDGRAVDPFVDPDSFWVNPIRYVGDQPTVYMSGVTNYLPSSHIKERPSDVDEFKQSAWQTPRVWARFAGVHKGDQVQFVWKKPDGSTFWTTNISATAEKSEQWWDDGRTLPFTPDLGTWTVEFKVNGTKLGQQTFEVTAEGAAEVRIEDEFGGIILDERYTPVDFGVASQHAANPSRTFHVINHGDDTLTLGEVVVPGGYLVTQGLPASLAPGGSATLVVEMNTSDSGYYAGQVRIETNDASEPEYNFSIEGVVASAALDRLLLGIAEREIDEGTEVVANVRRLGSTAHPLTVSLTSADSTELATPATVTIPAGESTVRFVMQGLDDDQDDGDQVVRLAADAAGYATAIVSGITVADVDSGDRQHDGAPVIDLGEIMLLPDTPGQVFAIDVKGGHEIQGAVLNIQIEGGYPDVPGSDVDGPNITNVELAAAGTVFGNVPNSGNNFIATREQMWVVGTSATDGTVVADGVLAYVTIDTSGWFGGDGPWQLRLADTFNGDTNLQSPDGQIAPIITNGSIRIDELPHSNPGGPYTVDEGGLIILDGSASSDPDAGDTIVQYQWDLDGDGVYGETGDAAGQGDEIGVSPAFSAVGLDGPAAWAISLRVLDDHGGIGDPQTALVTVNNVAPVLAPVGDPTIHRAHSLDLQDLSVTYTDAGMLDVHSATVDWGDGSGPGPVAVVEPSGTNAGEVCGMHSYVAGGVYTVTITVEDDDGAQDSATFHVNVLDAEVLGRYVFYNNSAWDGSDHEANANDGPAIAPDKEALLPGQTATFANYTSYSRGLNGIVIDVANLTGTPTVADFAFLVGNNDDPSTWSTAPAPRSITVRPGTGVNGSDRVTIIWADDNPYTPEREPGSISNQWLQVTALATANTGLGEADVFYVGNAIGESGNSTIETNVDTNDEIGARNHPHSLFDPAPLEDAFDYDRDRRVDTNDEILARNNSTSAFTRLGLITVPPLAADDDTEQSPVLSVAAAGGDGFDAEQGSVFADAFAEVDHLSAHSGSFIGAGEDVAVNVAADPSDELLTSALSGRSLPQDEVTRNGAAENTLTPVIAQTESEFAGRFQTVERGHVASGRVVSSALDSLADEEPFVAQDLEIALSEIAEDVLAAWH